MSGEIKQYVSAIKLYRHVTGGGAEYLTDKFIVCPDGSKEGIFEGAKFIVRLDGEPELIVVPKVARKRKASR